MSKSKSKIVKIPAGLYAFGDPCYAYKDLTLEQQEEFGIYFNNDDDTWDLWCDLNMESEEQEIGGIKVAMYYTAHGDGTYAVDWIQGDPYFYNRNKGYIPAIENYTSMLGVDSGTIGLVPIRLGVTPAEQISSYERLVSLYLDMVQDFVLTVGDGCFILSGLERNLGWIEIVVDTDPKTDCSCGRRCDCD